MLKLKTTNIGRIASAADLIQEALREAIVHGDMQDGEVLRQDQIASLFNVSRIPVREALARLEAQGLVTNHRYKGAVVTALSVEEIAETFEFRALVEPEVIRRSVLRMSAEALAEAEAHCAAFSSETDPGAWAQCNRAFHYALYRDADRPYHLQIVSSALDKVGRYLRAQLVLTNGMGRAREEHLAILDACRSGNADEAARLTRDHILGASRPSPAFCSARRDVGRSAKDDAAGPLVCGKQAAIQRSRKAPVLLRGGHDAAPDAPSIASGEAVADDTGARGRQTRPGACRTTDAGLAGLRRRQASTSPLCQTRRPATSSRPRSRPGETGPRHALPRTAQARPRSDAALEARGMKSAPPRRGRPRAARRYAPRSLSASTAIVVPSDREIAQARNASASSTHRTGNG